MNECEFIEQCPFFNGQLQGDLRKIEAMKQKYCRTNNLNCARYMVAHALGKDHMPKDLFPDQKTIAYSVIAESSLS